MNAGGAILFQADLAGAKLRRATLDQADLRGANLSGANLEFADLDLARLEGADLRRAVLRSARLAAVSLEDARLEGADLSKTRDLSDSYYSTGLYYDSATVWPAGFNVPRNRNALNARIQAVISRFGATIVLEWGGLIVLIILLGLATSFVASAAAEAKKVREQQKKIDVLEKPVQSPPPSSVTAFVQSELTVAVERERVNMLRADGRATRLFLLGTLFVVLAVSAPALGLAIYLRSDPVLDIARAKANDVAVTTSADALKRDWRVLLAGISAGFLFLAAAGGVLRQSRHQTATFFRLVQRVSHIEGLISSCRIVERLSSETDEVVRAHLARVVAILMTPFPMSEIDEREDSERHASIPQLLTILKKES